MLGIAIGIVICDHAIYLNLLLQQFINKANDENKTERIWDFTVQ